MSFLEKVKEKLNNVLQDYYKRKISVDGFINLLRNDDFVDAWRNDALSVKNVLKFRKGIKGVQRMEKLGAKERYRREVDDAILRALKDGVTPFQAGMQAAKEAQEIIHSEEQAKSDRNMQDLDAALEVRCQTARQDDKIAEAEKFMAVVDRKQAPMLYTRFEVWKEANERMPADRTAEDALAMENPGLYRTRAEDIRACERDFSRTAELFMQKGYDMRREAFEKLKQTRAQGGEQLMADMPVKNINEEINPGAVKK